MVLTVFPRHQLSLLFLLVSVVMLIGSFIATLLKTRSILIYSLDFPRGLQEQQCWLPPGLSPLFLAWGNQEKDLSECQLKSSTALFGQPQIANKSCFRKLGPCQVWLSVLIQLLDFMLTNAPLSSVRSVQGGMAAWRGFTTSFPHSEVFDEF